jgi:hypothetical protein
MTDELTPLRRPGCPDPAVVLALEEGVLDEPVAARIRAHLSECPACRRAAADLAQVFDEPVPAESQKRIDALIAAGRRDASPKRGFWGWLVPAGLAVATGLVWMVVATRPALAPGSEAGSSDPASLAARKLTPPVPSVFVVDRPAIPPGDVELAVRGETSAKGNLPADLAAALDLADNGDVATALTKLQALGGAHPTSRQALLALGGVQLRAGQNAEAVTTLERARSLKSDPEIQNEVDWFMSIALVRTGDRARARGLLDGVCKRSGARATSACAGVAELDR